MFVFIISENWARTLIAFILLLNMILIILLRHSSWHFELVIVISSTHNLMNVRLSMATTDNRTSSAAIEALPESGPTKVFLTWFLDVSKLSTDWIPWRNSFTSVGTCLRNFLFRSKGFNILCYSISDVWILYFFVFLSRTHYNFWFSWSIDYFLVIQLIIWIIQWSFIIICIRTHVIRVDVLVSLFFAKLWRHIENFTNFESIGV